MSFGMLYVPYILLLASHGASAINSIISHNAKGGIAGRGDAVAVNAEGQVNGPVPTQKQLADSSASKLSGQDKSFHISPAADFLDVSLLEEKAAPEANPAPEEFCSEGFKDGDTCCAKSCGGCGGPVCSSMDGGKSQCCVGAIHRSNIQCASTHDVACVIPQQVTDSASTDSAATDSAVIDSAALEPVALTPGSNFPPRRVVTWCNTMTCPPNHYLRQNALQLECAGPECGEQDTGTCCIQLTKEMEGKWCKGSQHLNWFDGMTLSECTTAAINNGWNFFVHGVGGHLFNVHQEGKNTQKCYWMLSMAPLDCQGPDCCNCEGCAVVSDEKWDFYKLA